MTTFTNVSDTVLEPGDPIRSVDIIAIKDNTNFLNEKHTTNVQTFDSSGTWTKPTNNGTPVGTIARIQMWAGGGGGARDAGGGAVSSGGGGGGYAEFTIPLSDIPSSVAVTVGAGGAGRTGSAGAGSNGGNTSFGTIGTVYGGAGGTNSSYGGGGSTSTAGNGEIPGKPNVKHFAGGDGFAGNAQITDRCSSTFGGGGGAGHTGGSGNFSGGYSSFGGNGGSGGSTSSSDGFAPAGGGGGRFNANAGNGASGRVIVTVW